MRAAFKYWKRRKPPPDFEKALDFHNYSTDSCIHNVTQITPESVTDEIDYDQFGLEPPNKWNIFTIDNNKGLIYIKNPFTSAGQRYWIIRCLKDFSKKPYKLNIDAHGYLNENEDWWTVSHDNNSERARSLLKSLRWSTLGYHHDWDSKLYTESNRNDFPIDLEKMCEAIASAIGFKDYLAQASIVNYYHMDSTLAPHTDHSEKNLDAPLISISFGQSAIFLIGGESENDEPTPLFLHSGDIVVMSKESRLSYHAVPKIINTTDLPYEMNKQDVQEFVKNEKEHFSYNVRDNELWAPFNNYLSHSRININVRQVLHHNQKTLDDNR